MAHLVWTADLDTGIGEIDRQHRRIATYINTLYDLRASPDRQALSRVIADTAEYTESHFAFEENLLEQAGYEFSGPHKKVHELFIRRIVSVQQRFEAGEDVADELHQVLSRWLFSHIRNEDHVYVETVKKYLQNTRAAQRANGGGAPRAADARTDYEALFPELEQRMPKKGWLARLFSR